MNQWQQRQQAESIQRWKDEKEQRWFRRPKPKPVVPHGRLCPTCRTERALTGACDNCD